MDKQQSNRDSNIIITAKIEIESSRVLYFNVWFDCLKRGRSDATDRDANDHYANERCRCWFAAINWSAERTIAAAVSLLLLPLLMEFHTCCCCCCCWSIHCCCCRWCVNPDRRFRCWCFAAAVFGRCCCCNQRLLIKLFSFIADTVAADRSAAVVAAVINQTPHGTMRIGNRLALSLLLLLISSLRSVSKAKRIGVPPHLRTESTTRLQQHWLLFCLSIVKILWDQMLFAHSQAFVGSVN